MLKKVFCALSVSVLVLSLSACGGSSTKTTVEQTETQGQQLIDLKSAYDEGIISEKEYKKAKKDILDQ